MGEYNYYRYQVTQLGESDRYLLKVISGTDGETKWMSISRGQLDRIADILAEGGNNGSTRL
jgi:hypothetical protein